MRGSDVRGAARLASEATAGLVDLVEAMHERIARVPFVGKAPAAGSEGRTRGITGLVYKSVRGVTRLVGGSVDALLGLLAPAIQTTLLSPEREAIVAALNGVLGDHLVATANALATPMRMRVGGQALVLKKAALAERLPQATGRVLVLVHGLCMNDLQWRRKGHDHGAALAQAAGYTPVYLHYNSGLHISTNGAAFAALMKQLVAQWPQAIERLVVIGHSMGGLVTRSALHQAAQARRRWPRRVDDVVFLGTPHHGAPLERAGNGLDLLLGVAPYSAQLARLGMLRSAGITDLRHGSLLDAEWAGSDRFAPGGAGRRHAVPLPAGVRFNTVATSLGADAADVKARLLGDGLVPLDSALGRHKDPAFALAFDADRQWVGHGINHMDQLGSKAVFAQLERWLR